MLRRQSLGPALVLAAASCAAAASPCALPAPQERSAWEDALERTSYDVGVKTLLRHMAANAYAGDLHAAMSALAAEKPEIVLGDAPDPEAGGKSRRFSGGRPPLITVNDRALYLKRPGLEPATLQWSDAESYRRALGLAPRLQALDPRARPVEVYEANSGVVTLFGDGSSLGDWSLDHMAVVLLHELIHLDTSVRGGEAREADELRASLASDRMKRLIARRGRDRWQLHEGYQSWLRDPAAAAPPGLAQRLALRRRELAQELQRGDQEFADLAHGETLEGLDSAVREYRALADELLALEVFERRDWSQAMAFIQDLHQEALLEDFLWPPPRRDLRAAWRERLRRLEYDERLYRETLGINEAWARECREPRD